MDGGDCRAPVPLPVCRNRRRRLDDAVLPPCTDARPAPPECVVMYLEAELDETGQQYELSVVVIYVRGNDGKADEAGDGDFDPTSGCRHAAQSRPCSSQRLAIRAVSHGSFDPV